MGYASWSRVAIRFTPDGEVVEAVTSEPGGRAERSRLIMSTLVYADEVVPVDEVEELTSLGDVAVADREVKMAEMLVESLTSSSTPTSTPTSTGSRSST